MTVARRATDDPTVIHKCQLFVAMSLIQQEHFAQARSIVHSVFLQNKARGHFEDARLKNMCLGIWARLRHAMRQSRPKKM